MSLLEKRIYTFLSNRNLENINLMKALEQLECSKPHFYLKLRQFKKGKLKEKYRIYRKIAKVIFDLIKDKKYFTFNDLKFAIFEIYPKLENQNKVRAFFTQINNYIDLKKYSNKTYLVNEELKEYLLEYLK